MNKTKLDKIAKVMFIISLVCVTLYLGHVILMPIIFSAFIAVILMPVVKFFERIRFGKLLSTLTAVLLSTTILFGLFFMIAVQTHEIVNDLPIQSNELSAEGIMKKPAEMITNELPKSFNKYEDLIQKGLEQLKTGTSSIFKESLVRLKDTIVFFVTLPIYIFFMLLYRNNLFRFFKELLNDKDLENGKDLLDDVKSVLQSYLKGLVFVILIVGVLTTTGLLLLGIKYAVIIGMISALLTLIPFVGVVISAMIPMTVALMTKDSGWYALGVAGVYAIVQFLEGNFITPKIMGNTVNLNPLVIIISLVLMGALTGIVGMILTIPILAVFKVITDHYPSFKHWQILMEEKAVDDDE